MGSWDYPPHTWDCRRSIGPSVIPYKAGCLKQEKEGGRVQQKQWKGVLDTLHASKGVAQERPTTLGDYKHLLMGEGGGVGDIQIEISIDTKTQKLVNEIKSNICRQKSDSVYYPFIASREAHKSPNKKRAGNPSGCTPPNSRRTVLPLTPIVFCFLPGRSVGGKRARDASSHFNGEDTVEDRIHNKIDPHSEFKNFHSYGSVKNTNIPL